MSLKEKTAQILEKTLFGYKMGFDSNHRTRWLSNRLQTDLSSGGISPDEAEKILAQSRDPKTSRHFAETFAIPLIAAAIGGVGSLQTFNYAVETGDPLAWGYTLSHLAVNVPKVSFSSATRAILLGGSVILDHIQDKEVGSWSRIGKEFKAIGISGISWMGTGNIGPAMRMARGAPDLGPYLLNLTKQESASKISEHPPTRKNDTNSLYYQCLVATG